MFETSRINERVDIAGTGGEHAIDWVNQNSGADRQGVTIIAGVRVTSARLAGCTEDGGEPRLQEKETS